MVLNKPPKSKKLSVVNYNFKPPVYNFDPSSRIDRSNVKRQETMVEHFGPPTSVSNSPNSCTVVIKDTIANENSYGLLHNVDCIKEQLSSHPGANDRSSVNNLPSAVDVVNTSLDNDLQQTQPLLEAATIKVYNEWSNKSSPIKNSNSLNNNNSNNNGSTPQRCSKIVSCETSYHGDIGADAGSYENYRVPDDASGNGAKKLQHHRTIPIANGNVVVDIAVADSSDSQQWNKFPEEKMKTFYALLILVLNFILTTASLAMVHERVPDRNTYKPLPDTFLDLVPAHDWALFVSEVLIMITTNATFVLLLFHKHRFIVFRRMFLMLSLLYMMRSVTMFVTVLPVSSTTYYCSPKADGGATPATIVQRVFQLFSGMGLTINGKHTFCGDYMYSGHTTILVMSYLLICEYSPKKFYLLHWLAWFMAFSGVVMVLVAHGHYTVDVIVAYFITTRLFWLYHTLANNQYLKQKSANNYLANEWWFPIFAYFEGNVRGPVPLQFNCPLPYSFPWPITWWQRRRRIR